MMQSTHGTSGRLHAAIIMDGNGRWALARGLPRLAGHRAGADALRRTVEAAPDLGIGMLTLFAFSSDNWRRPPEEVAGLMQLLAEHLRSETSRCLESGVRIEVIGRRDRLGGELPAALHKPNRSLRAARNCSCASRWITLDATPLRRPCGRPRTPAWFAASAWKSSWVRRWTC
jgi:undecaprenyl diphosphate synthase